MRVLYLTKETNTQSETYIYNEMRWVQNRGIDVFLLAHQRSYRPPPSPIPEDRVRAGGTLRAAIEAFRPDVIHAHWCSYTPTPYLNELKNIRPVTIRGHSFGGKQRGEEDIALELCRHDAVKRIWLFPHMAAAVPPHEKISAMTTCFDPALYFPLPASLSPVASDLSPSRVFRATAGLTIKGIDEFLAVARLCPDISFLLVHTLFSKSSVSVSQGAPDNCLVKYQLRQEEVAELMRGSDIYLRGYDTSGYTFAMPVSICEALATGLTPVLPDLPQARAYAGPAARYYKSPAEAAVIIRQLVLRNWEERIADRLLSLRQAEQYAQDRVLPPLIAEWQKATQ